MNEFALGSYLDATVGQAAREFSSDRGARELKPFADLLRKGRREGRYPKVDEQSELNPDVLRDVAAILRVAKERAEAEDAALNFLDDFTEDINIGLEALGKPISAETSQRLEDVRLIAGFAIIYEKFQQQSSAMTPRGDEMAPSPINRDRQGAVMKGDSKAAYDIGPVFEADLGERKPVFRKHLRNVLSQALFDGDGTAGFIAAVLKDFGADIPDDVALLAEGDVVQQVSEMRKAYSKDWTMEGVAGILKGVVPESGAFETLLTLGTDVVFTLRDGSTREVFLGAQEAYNFLNGHIGEILEIGKNLPEAVHAQLIEAYPEYETEFRLIRGELTRDQLLQTYREEYVRSVRGLSSEQLAARLAELSPDMREKMQYLKADTNNEKGNVLFERLLRIVPQMSDGELEELLAEFANHHEVIGSIYRRDGVGEQVVTFGSEVAYAKALGYLQAEYMHSDRRTRDVNEVGASLESSLRAREEALLARRVEKATDLKGRKLWRSGRTHNKANAANLTTKQSVEAGEPIIMSEFSAVVRKQIALDEHTYAFLDHDPLGVGEDGYITVGSGGEIIAQMDDRKVRRDRASGWVDYVVKDLVGVDYEEIVAISPRATSFKYDRYGEPRERGLSPGLMDAASIDHPNYKHLPDRKKGKRLAIDVLAISNIGAFTVGGDMRVVTMEVAKDSAVNISQGFLGLNAVLNLEHYYEYYNILNVQARKHAGATLFADSISRMWRRHAVIQALHGDSRILYFRDPLNIQFDDDELHLESIVLREGSAWTSDEAEEYFLKDITNRPRPTKKEWAVQLITDLFFAEKSLDDFENIVAAITQRSRETDKPNLDSQSGGRVDKPHFTNEQSRRILQNARSLRICRQLEKTTTGVKIKRKRTDEWAYWSGMSAQDRAVLFEVVEAKDHLASQGFEVDKLTPEEIRGPLAVALMIEADGVQQTQISAVRDELLKHVKYAGYAEKLKGLLAQQVTADIQAIRAKTLADIGADPFAGADVQDAVKSLFGILMTQAGIQPDANIRAEFAKTALELEQHIGETFPWLNADQVNAIMFRHVYNNLKLMGYIHAITAWEKAHQLAGVPSPKEGATDNAPGSDRKPLELDLTRPDHKALAGILRAGGFVVTRQKKTPKVWIVDGTMDGLYPIRGSYQDSGEYRLAPLDRSSYGEVFAHESPAIAGGLGHYAKAYAERLMDGGIVHKSTAERIYDLKNNPHPSNQALYDNLLRGVLEPIGL